MIIATHDQAACERDQRCNWNSEIVDNSSCISPIYGDKFCARTDGHWTHEISYFPRCPLQRNLADQSAGWDIFTQSECTANGGTWMPSQHDPNGFHDCWDCCSFTSTPPASEADCIDQTICKKFTETHSSWTWTHYGECGHQAFCYDRSTLGNETDCKIKNLDQQPDWAVLEWNHGDWSIWPKYTVSSEESDTPGFHWKLYNTHANLNVSVCMYGRRWGAQSYEAEGTYTTQAACEGAGLNWHIPRRYEEGRWANEADCLQGVCSSDPWDHRLANEALCTQQSGSCTERCKKCERHDHSLDSVMCVATNITTETDCNGIANMQWRSNHVYNEDTKVWEESPDRACVGTMSNTDCTSRNDHVQVSCSDVPWETCETTGRTGLYKSVFGGCYKERWAKCESNTACAATGQCNDWGYEYWDWDDTQRRNSLFKACRVPHKARAPPDHGIDDKACQTLAASLSDVPYNNDHEDACILYKLNQQECAGVGGVLVERADTKDQCESRQQCFHKQHRYPINHTITQTECQNECEDTRYEWRSVRKYTSGIWSPATMQPGQWTRRAMVQSNEWRLRADHAMYQMMYKALYSMWADSYKTEQLCLIEPYIDVFQTIACACNPSGTEPAGCSDVFSANITTTTIAEYCCFSDVTCNIETAAGIMVIEKDQMNGLNAGCHKQQMSFGFSGDQIQNIDRRRQISSSTCNDYALVPGTSSGIVGQIIGNAFEVQGIGFLGAGKKVKVCVPIDSKIPTCTGKYDTLDLSKGTADKTPGPPLSLAVTNDGGNLCADVTTDGMASMLFFPILRTKDGLPHVGFTGQVVKAEVKITGFASKEVFTVERQAAFKSALAQVINNNAITADDIVILKICDVDSSGNVGECTVVYSNRRSTGGGISVEYQVQVADNSGVSTSDIKNTMTGGSFAQDFTNAMNQQLTDGSSVSLSLDSSSVVEETVVASTPPPSPATPSPSNSPTPSGTTASPPEIKAASTHTVPHMLLVLFATAAAILSSGFGMPGV